MTERKIAAGLFISLDGVIESPDQWHFDYFNDEMGEIVGGQMAESDAMLLGRTTWEMFAGYWPHQSNDVQPAEHMNGVRKYVVSSTLDNVDAWPNSTLVKDDPKAQLTALKQQPGQTIGVTGSAKLVDWLLREGLLDELNLLIHPVVVGHGQRLFPEGTPHTGLSLANSRVLQTGVIYASYVPAS